MQEPACIRARQPPYRYHPAAVLVLFPSAKRPQGVGPRPRACPPSAPAPLGPSPSPSAPSSRSPSPDPSTCPALSLALPPFAPLLPWYVRASGLVRPPSLTRRLAPCAPYRLAFSTVFASRFVLLLRRLSPIPHRRLAIPVAFPPVWSKGGRSFTTCGDGTALGTFHGRGSDPSLPPWPCSPRLPCPARLARIARLLLPSFGPDPLRPPPPRRGAPGLWL